MVEKHNFRNDRFERELMEGTAEPAKVRAPLGRHIAAGLAMALLLAFGMLATPSTSSARVAIGISVNFGPPPLPVYVQPPCPGPGYIWTPGYWAYAPDAGYYWVPGTWVPAPFIGALWTPGYWGFSAGVYLWHPGYWGTRVGFYGGIDYGFGYTGYGYHGGYWDHDRFYYNRAVNRLVGREFRHVYYRREDHHFRRGRRISFHGGPGGIDVRPTREQRNARRFRHFGPIHQQLRHQRFARSRPEQRWRVNHGHPQFASTPRAGEYRGYRRFDRGHSANGPRYSAPQRRQARRGFARENRGNPARANNFRRSQRQVRGGEQRANNFRRSQYQARGGARRGSQGHGRQQERGHADNGHGHGNEHGNGHGRGGRR